MEALGNFAVTLFNWAIDHNATSDCLVTKGPSILAWILIFLIGITLFSNLIFYYFISSVAANATKRNYLVVFGLGVLVLWLTNLIIIPSIVGDWSYALGRNNLVVSAIDTIYYVILYEFISFFVKDMGTNAKHIHLINCIF